MGLVCTRFPGRGLQRTSVVLPPARIRSWPGMALESCRAAGSGRWGRAGRISRPCVPDPGRISRLSGRTRRCPFWPGVLAVLLPCETVRCTPEPDRAVAEFLSVTYEAAAVLGNRGRSASEGDPLRWDGTAMSRRASR
ncbi:DUF5996 family protein [Streptomyces sp. NPDC049916]|uniref:DUF5996 family protein n=1 Tax=Streptomyces sp. NPDC049916 TaxID=3155156 RepID=UPI0034176C16